MPSILRLMAEYYIREEDSDEARGPFTIDELQSLAEAGKIEAETLYYDDQKEAWLKIASNADLQAEVFPIRKSLTLRTPAREEPEVASEGDSGEDEGPALSVQTMLAEAEGQTGETRHVRNKLKSRERAASLAVPGLGVMMLLSTAAFILPSLDIIQRALADENFLPLLQQPMILLGLFDLFMAVCLFLSVTEVFPILRLRAMLGLGYFGFYNWGLWVNGAPGALEMMAAMVAANLGIFAATLARRTGTMLIAILVGVSGMAAFVWFAL